MLIRLSADTSDIKDAPIRLFYYYSQWLRLADRANKT
jgi:hypothetical protein